MARVVLVCNGMSFVEFFRFCFCVFSSGTCLIVITGPGSFFFCLSSSFFSYFLWSGVSCCVLVPGMIALFRLLYLNLSAFAFVFSVSQSATT